MERSGAPVRVAALALLCAADVLVMLDGMVVTVALPAIQRDLGVARADLQWVVTAYTLTLGAFLLVGGRVADLYGRRRTLVVGLVLFTLASLGAGLARAPAALIAARAVQGLGAALAIPAALALLAATFRQERERQRALGLLSVALDAGMVAGLVVGGVVTAALGWPWCFFIVVPFGLVAAALAPVALEESRDGDGPRRLDVPGAALAASGFALVVLGLVRTEQGGLGLEALAPAALGLVVLAGFVLHERRTPAPLLRLSVLRQRSLAGANLSVAANAGGFGGMTFLATLYMQQVLGFSALRAGLAFVPLALSAGLGGVAAPSLVLRAGPRLASAASLAVTAAAFVLLARVPERDGYVPALLPGFLLAGFTFAVAFVALGDQGLRGVREAEAGIASGLFQTSTHLGGAVVLAVLATAATASGFAAAFLAGAGVVVAGALVALATLPATPPRRG